MKKIILITGGAGFIGSNFIHYMLNKYPEYEIVNLDKLTYAGNLENLKEVENNKNYHFVKGDITNRELVEHIFEEFNPQYVVNFAAESHVDRSIEGPEIFVKTNVYGTHVLLDVAKEYWENKKMEDVRFIQISTDEVYGSLPLESKEKFTEESPLRPNSPYSATKAGADLICRSYFITYNFPVIITRSSNNFGPRQYPEKLIPLTIKRALEGKPIPVYGDGQNVRDWLYVEDNCKGIDLVLHKGRIGEIYNIGGGNEWKNIDLVNLICGIIAEIKGEDAERYKRLITFVKDRPGHDRRYALSIEKIKSELGWKPESDFLEALKFTVKWYMERWEGII
ncbi:dTDP-glucose 4,6-dehydratase [Dictyoglomus thermophilum]|uniref:dTDP-glucose 4,6-dehydratase n=1 Tax=Dictyoglomus thermophilum (strain ATCC 35947 / DSM 3960 / H-6-12) TaxID=309799 RepID=B5YBG8_DICT6|nr:dTDP-glucose 4,6-dehydratase [Dictyoglomus thermophilum]ACI18686.1 dTDP-glucose 4,6-dehydratase [Dictyoglomus thermophilum H-6-12]